jgi:hypothetical protein
MAAARSFEVIFLTAVVDTKTQPTLTAAGLLPPDLGSFCDQKNPATAGGERRMKNVSEQATTEEAPQTSLFPENQEFQRSTRNQERQ